jgi:hypothetical protein
MSSCCGGARGARRRPPKPGPVAGTEQVLMAYVGPRDELFTTRGPATRTRYLASAREHERRVPVYVEDVAGLEATRLWVRAEEGD